MKEDVQMDRRIPFPRLVASSLLGVIAFAAFVAAAFVLFGSWVAADGSPIVEDVGSAGAALVGLLLVAFGIVATLAARDTFTGSARGHVLGFVTSIVAVLAAVAALIEGGTLESALLLYIAVGLGVAAFVAVTANALTHPEPASAAG
jgi:hypothetical protein